jgi:hypothetical protein
MDVRWTFAGALWTDSGAHDIGRSVTDIDASAKPGPLGSSGSGATGGRTTRRTDEVAGPGSGSGMRTTGAAPAVEPGWTTCGI